MTRILRISLWLSGVSFFVWACFDTRFRDSEGFFCGGFCVPIAVGMALVILGCLVNSRIKKSAFWFTLALIGQAVALQMIEAGPSVRYQHYKSLYCLLTEVHLLLLIYIGVQTILVVAGFRTRWPIVHAWIKHTFKTWQLLCVGIIFFISSATLSIKISAFVAELLFSTYVQTVNLGSIILMVWALPNDVLTLWKQRFKRFFGCLENQNVEKRGSIDCFVILAATWVTVIAAVLSYFSYERHPHIPDEVSYLYHARYFASGMLTMPVPPVPDAFNIDLMHYEPDRWYSPFPPGWPLMLAIGVIFGAPWLVNPVLAGLNVLMTYIFITQIYDSRTARNVILLICFSPWFVFMGMNFMAHTFTLTCALVASLAIIKARNTGDSIWGWLSGAVVGLICLIRPLDGLAMAGLIGLWTIGIGGRRLKLASITAFILGTIMIIIVVLSYNKLLTGNVNTFPVMAYFNKYYGFKTNALGFGPERGLDWKGLDPLPGHGIFDVLINANFNIFSINIELFGWSTGSLILVALFLISRTMQRSDYLMLAVIATIIGIHSFYWFSGGPDFGARYWYLVIVPCVVLTVRGIQFLEKTFETDPSGSTGKSTYVIIAVLALCTITLVNYFPWRAIDKYHHYRGMRPDIRYIAKEYNFGKSLVLIQGKRHPDYASAAIYNPLDIHANASVYAWDQNPEVRAQVLHAYPDRPVWIVNGPTMTNGAFKVVEGPLSVNELLTREN